MLTGNSFPPEVYARDKKSLDNLIGLYIITRLFEITDCKRKLGLQYVLRVLCAELLKVPKRPFQHLLAVIVYWYGKENGIQTDNCSGVEKWWICGAGRLHKKVPVLLAV